MARPAIHLLGCPSLFDAAGAPVSGGPTQRHRVALIAQLVVASPSVVSRDRLIGVLWPERDVAAARRLLNVAVTVLRQTFGAAAIVSVGDDLRLDATLVDADVHRFERALDEGRLEDAVESCRGVFLEGFFLDDAEEFERWVETQRLRLARRFVDALMVLATRATAAGDTIKAAAWWRALHHAEPSNSTVVLRLMEVLEASGDVTAALAVEEAHRAYMHDELDAEPDHRIATRGDAIRRALIEARRDVQLPRVAPPRRAAAPAAANPKERSRNRLAIALAMSALVALGGSLAFNRIRTTVMPANVNPVAAILPLTPASDMPGDLGEQVAELLALNLGQVDGVTFVRPDTALAGRHASMVVSGRLSSDTKNMIATFVILDSAGVLVGTATATARNGPGVVPALVDAATIPLARIVWGRRWQVPEPRVEAVTTKSIPALNAFLQGEARFRRLQYDSAAMALETAVDLDSTFALAYFRLAEVNAFRGGEGNSVDPLNHAMRLIDRLPPRERAKLRVRYLEAHGKMEAYEAAEALAREYPQDPDARYARADIMFHSRALRDLPIELQYELWDAAIAADPYSLRPFAHLPDLTTNEDTPDRFDRYVALSMKRDGARPASEYARLRSIRWGPLAAARDTLAAMVRASAPNPTTSDPLFFARSALTGRCFTGLVDCGNTLQWSLDLMQRAFSAHVGMWMWDPRTRTAMTLGSGRLQSVLDFPPQYLHARVAEVARLAAFGYGTPEIAAALDARLVASGERSWTVSFERVEMAIARRDIKAARRLLDSANVLSRIRWDDGTPDSGSFAPGWDRALNGWIVALEGDTARAIAEMRAGLNDGGWSGRGGPDGAPLINEVNGLMAAWPASHDVGIEHLRTALTTADAWWPWVRYQLARALDARGDREEAARQYERFALVWRNADPPLRHFGIEAAARARHLSRGLEASSEKK